MYEFPCDRKEYKGNPSYYYRTHPMFQLKVIPSLYYLRNVILLTQGVITQLIDDDCSDEAKVLEFITNSLSH